MIRTKNILTVMAAAMTLAACNEMDDVLNRELQPIRLTTNIAQTTRAITPTQETVIATGQIIYVWANEEATPGTADWTQNPYLNAWRLTKGDGSPNEWSSQSSTPYYPTRPMSMVAVHGNLQPSIVEERTQVPASVVHTVKTDQRLLADYAASDLLYWNATGVNAVSNNPIQITFGHKLAKIEIELKNTDGLYTEEDLRDAVVTLNSLMTSATLTVTDATPGNMGQLSAATGTATTIRPYAANGLQREAIVPPQAKPANLITISLHGYTYTLDPAQPTTDFATNTRYHYILTVNKHAITQETQITPWGDYTAGGSDPVTITSEFGMHPKNIKMNPLWYVAETNVDYTAANGSKTWDSGSGKFFLSTTQNGGYYFSWADAMKYFSSSANVSAGTPTSVTSYYSGNNIYVPGWHMPTLNEWKAIVPARYDNNAGLTFFQAGGILTTDNTDYTYIGETSLCFGYNDETKGSNGQYVKERSYWYRNSGIIYAIRYCGTPYCSVWKYELIPNGGSTASPGCVIITSKLLGRSLTVEQAKTQYGMTEANYTAEFANLSFKNGNDEPNGAVQRVFGSLGYNTSGTNSSPNTSGGINGFYWAAEDVETYAWHMSFCTYGNQYLGIYTDARPKTEARSVRLFRDNPEKDVWKNPLWYVAEYNMTNAVNAGTLTMAAADDAGYYYRWVDAMSTFGTSSTSYDGYKKGNKTISGKSGTWHLPTISEFRSIIPNVNIWTDSNYDANGDGYYSHNVGVVWGCNYETKTIGVRDSMFIHKVSAYEVHAIRFLGTPYCSAWKYTVANNTLTISATMIDYIENIMYNAKKFYDEKWPSIYFGNDVSKGAVQRRFYERGWIVSSSNTSGPNWNAAHDSSFWFWSATQDSSDNTKGLGVYSSGETSGFGCSSTTKTYSFPIRLFLDN